MLFSATLNSIGIVLISSKSANKSIDVENVPGLSAENLIDRGSKFSSDLKSFVNIKINNLNFSQDYSLKTFF